MYKKQKKVTIEKLKPIFEGSHFYIVDLGAMNANQSYSLRHMLFKEEIICRHISNALLKRILSENSHQEVLVNVLKQNSTLLFTKKHPAVPAKIIQAFRKQETIPFPLLKGAWVFGSVFIGEQHLNALAKLKSREEYIGDVAGILQSQSWQLIRALQHGQDQLCGILKTIASHR